MPLKVNLDDEGIWRVFVYAQEVNRTAPGTPPGRGRLALLGDVVGVGLRRGSTDRHGDRLHVRPPAGTPPA